MDRYEGTMRFGVSEVRRRVDAAGLPKERLHVVAGWVEDVTAFPERIAFAYIDFDFYRPISTALRIVDGRMPPGGTIIVDDYGFFSAGAQTAVDEFLAVQGKTYEIVRPLEFAGHLIILRRIL